MYALYIRTSTNHQKLGKDTQLKALENKMKSLGVSGYKTFLDTGVSGSKSNRKGLNELLEEVRAGRVEAIVTFSLSRLARSTKHLIELVEEFQRANVNLISLSEEIDLTSAMGRAFFRVIAVLAELERELVSERTSAGLTAARERGVQLGRRKTRNSDLIRELRKQHYSYAGIARLVGCSKSTVWRELVGSVRK